MTKQEEIEADIKALTKKVSENNGEIFIVYNQGEDDTMSAIHGKALRLAYSATQSDLGAAIKLVAMTDAFLDKDK